MSKRLNVYKDQKPIYDIVMEPSFEKLTEEVNKFHLSERKICIVTDTNVAPLYLEEVKERLSKCCKKISYFVIPAGEENKNLDTVKKIYEHLILEHFDRKDMLAALGGGVIGDMCGFTAATYLRGIDFIQIPTTLLSQVDSSIGGKTGVDFDAYKNMVGAFHMPRLVYTNLNTLLTLPKEQFSSGMGEVIKHGLIKDASYYQWLKDNRESILKRDLAVCEDMVYRSNEIKKQVVENDPTEQGERALLNFGHTLGHAVEKLMNFKEFHGHCVGLGCIAASKISALRGMISEEQVQDIKNTFEAFEMPVTVSGLDWKDVYATTKSDKKMDSGVVKFILLKTVGNAHYCILDGGMNHLTYLGQMMGMKTPIIKHYKNTMVQDATADKKIWCLCGSLCTTSDILCREVEFDHLEIGDTLAFENVGAYSVTEGIYLFLSRAMPKVYLKDECGSLTLVRDAIETSTINTMNI